MKSRLINKNATVNTKKNDVQPMRRGGNSWHEINFKIEGGTEPDSAPTGATGADIFSKKNYQKNKK